MPDSLGDVAQVRQIVEQSGEAAAEIAIRKFVSQHPELRQASVTAEIPAPLKWAAIVASAVITVSASAVHMMQDLAHKGAPLGIAHLEERAKCRQCGHRGAAITAYEVNF